MNSTLITPTDRAVHPDALPALAAMLQHALETAGTLTFTIRGDIDTIDGGQFAGADAVTDFAAHTVDFRPGLSGVEFLHALTHELVHVRRGPALVDEVEAEERTVEDIAQGLLYSPVSPLGGNA